MSQQPYPPQYPQAPQQPGYPPQQVYPPQQPQPGYPAQPPYPQAPQQPYQQPYPPQQAYPAYGQQPQGYPPQGQPQQPLAQGSLDEFYSQPSASSGPGISWSDQQKMPRPVGTTFIGIVAREVTHADVQQQTNPQGVPQTFRDGRPKFQMKVPLKQVGLFDPQGQQMPTPEFPDGEATWYVRGQARDELTRAMAEAGVQGAPKAGAVVRITLVNRRPNGGGMQPSNIIQVSYQPGQGDSGAQHEQPTPATPAPAPVQEAPPQAPAPQQGQAPVYAFPSGAQIQAPQTAPSAQGAPAQPQQPQPGFAGQQYAAYAGQTAPQGQPQQPPVQAQPTAPAPTQQPPGAGMPPGFDAEQQALFARITGGQQPGSPAA